MVLSQVAAIFHGSPVLPVLLSLIDRGSPDLLSPNDILEVESVAVPHAPLGDFFSRKGSRLCPISIQCFGLEYDRKRALTPPASEHMKSVARPQQWSEDPGQEQSLLHPISLILPGN